MVLLSPAVLAVLPTTRPGPSSPLSSAPLPMATDVSPCAEGEQTCDLMFRLSGNAQLASWSDVIIGKPLAILGLVVLGLLIRWVLHRLVDRVTSRAESGVLPGAGATASARRKQRAGAMGGVLKSIVTAIVVAVITTMSLSELGVNIAPIIASAGILGLALGFGAQSLVKDFLSGMFIFIEDQYGVGDVVDLGEAIGTVEAVTLRMTRLRDINGTVWYVPNGEILRVGNQSQNWSRAVIDVGVGYGEDLARVKRVLAEVAHDLWDDEDFRDLIVEEPEVTGVEMLAADSVTVRVMVKTAPLRQWEVARELRQRIKARFDHEGIEIPFAQRVIWHRDERSGQAPTDSDPTPSGSGQQSA